jgi:phospholipid/cholesterol/gamma-HCH transport system substrate-binding protein
MIEQMKNVMIAIFTLTALAIIVFIILFLHPSLGDESKILNVRFADIDKLSTGTRVNFGGRPVGEVTNIREIVGPDGQRIEHNGIIYPYELTIAIDTDIVVYSTDTITSRTSGLLGEKSVAIIPEPVKKGVVRKVVSKESIIYADETGSVESTLKEFKELADKIEVTLDGFANVFTTLKQEKAWENVGKALSNLNEILTAFNQPEKLHQLLDNAVEGTRQIKELATALNRPKDLQLIINNFNSASGAINRVLDKVSAGKGSIGELLVKDDFYLRISSLISKAEVVLNDINHYGLLFSEDKGWKRLRARRLNLMQQLNYPQEFRNYFNDEIDAIVTGIERVSMVMEQAEQQFPCGELWQNPEYAKVYSDLLRRVAMLDEYLQMYNQQVMEIPVQKTELLECIGQ